MSASALTLVLAGLVLGEYRRIAAEPAGDTAGPAVPSLTDRETDVLGLARTGGSVAEIARTLHLSEATVRNHLSAAIGKTGARNRADAARIADQNGWL